ncbi:DUF4878 domain-containing protein [Campylobacter helveticus]|uniref:DUF4878 domain-containing protein n=1 Tax=Campylobacter helveticus TaxID=28898 RepID=A0ABY3L2I0_9BACT|nr:DUF4878 domain-containing protein [Campylobacter helveticus]MCR2038729.1 DUF4878 domain-containing protein [Campylobacter helveticus]MCR2056651.1 DUF4878 domain-containing protein [Campylobacter helveticus]MCR2059902.1 DUF4878 domain-containing protein [Campylobacter helveticus]MCR2064318.1 DUF4878 domain-containing protein [Campylobacter helveticus]MCR2065618.1 DUF4878 domain-containing protein [Campylobacter helveticus]
MRIIKTLFLSLVFAALFAGCGNSTTPGEVAKDFTNDMYEGDGEALVKYIYMPDTIKDSDKELVNGKLKAGAAKAKEQADARGGVKSIEIIDEKIEGDNAKVRLKITFNDDSSKEDGGPLKKIDNEWKMSLK